MISYVVLSEHHTNMSKLPLETTLNLGNTWPVPLIFPASFPEYVSPFPKSSARFQNLLSVFRYVKAMNNKYLCYNSLSLTGGTNSLHFLITCPEANSVLFVPKWWTVPVSGHFEQEIIYFLFE